MNIFTKFHKDWMTIVDFLSIAKFLASPIFTYSPSSSALMKRRIKYLAMKCNVPSFSLKRKSKKASIPTLYTHTPVKPLADGTAGCFQHLEEQGF